MIRKRDTERERETERFYNDLFLKKIIFKALAANLQSDLNWHDKKLFFSHLIYTRIKHYSAVHVTKALYIVSSTVSKYVQGISLPSSISC